VLGQIPALGWMEVGTAMLAIIFWAALVYFVLRIPVYLFEEYA
jgi:hypothetical protein